MSGKEFLLKIAKCTLVFILLVFILDIVLYFSHSIELVGGVYMRSRYSGLFLSEGEYARDADLSNVLQGRKEAATSKVIICSLARNCEKLFSRNARRVEALGKLFMDYRVVMFENDSKDETRAKLKAWSHQNPKVEIVDCCDLGSCECRLKQNLGYEYGVDSDDRILRMAAYRNQYMERVNKICSSSEGWKFMVVVDFDLKGGILRSGVYDTLGCANLWDGVFAAGLMPVPPFGLLHILYDGFAHVAKEEVGETVKSTIFQSWLDLFWHSVTGSLSADSSSNLIPVRSAFNGFAIYKLSVVCGCRYSVPPSRMCEHVGFHFSIEKTVREKKHRSTRFFINKRMTLYAGIQGPPNKFWTLLQLTSGSQ